MQVKGDDWYWGHFLSPNSSSCVGSRVLCCTLKQTPLNQFPATQGVYPLPWNCIDTVGRAGEGPCDGCGGVGVVAQVDGGKHAGFVAVGVHKAPGSGFKRVTHEAAGTDLVLGRAF